jgi:hypothetical protein
MGLEEILFQHMHHIIHGCVIIIQEYHPIHPGFLHPGFTLQDRVPAAFRSTHAAAPTTLINF